MALEAMKDSDVITDEVLRYSVDELVSRTRLLETEVKIMKSETMRISHELQAQKEKIKENTEKIKVTTHRSYFSERKGISGNWGLLLSLPG